MNPARVYLEQEQRDSVGRIFIVEIDVPRPTKPVAANAAYSIWSINLSNTFDTYTIGAEIDGMKLTTIKPVALFLLALCPGVPSSVSTSD